MSDTTLGPMDVLHRKDERKKYMYYMKKAARKQKYRAIVP